MIPALQTVLDVILGITPVPGLSAAFDILKLIVSAVEQASRSKQRLTILAQSAAQLLQTLNNEFIASRLAQSACREPLRELQSLLIDIQTFVRDEQARPFLKTLFTQDARLEGIDGFYRRIGTVADAFQISTLLNIQRRLSNDKLACN
ncbi:Kinase-like protein [Mycena venus]|uniref:Kinase-like protein n=1 Tax=Mycena venus TaxID=2733690 RepID=A0A8H6XKA9_9AGAR|nr:Kinase-like protein [Mycena venus]